MVRFVLAAAAILLATSPASAQGKPPIVSRAEGCLRANVDRVVAVEPDVESAATFLLDYACAAEVAGAARYELNLALVKQFGAMSATFPWPGAGNASPSSPTAPASVDPESGDIILPPRPPGSAPNLLTPMLQQTGPTSGQFTQLATPVSLRKLAGELVLEAREGRQIKSQ
jgi:hypothetical protein